MTPGDRRRSRLAAWRAALTALTEEICAAWGLTPESALAESTSRVLAVRDRAGRALALKLAPPGQGLEAEAAALAAFTGRGGLPVLRADLARGALLLPRAGPRALRDLPDDDEATTVAARLIARLPCPPPPGALFAEAAGWGRALLPGRVEEAMRDRAAGLLRDLIASAPPPLLLHGDLHGANVLRLREEWMALDPKGLLGEPAAEAACWLRNPADPARLSRAPRRAAILAEVAGLDRRRVLAWGYAGAVIAACWAVEDGTDPAPWLAAEAALRPLVQEF